MSDEEHPTPRRAYWTNELPDDLRIALIDALERDLAASEVEPSLVELSQQPRPSRRAFNLQDLPDAEAEELMEALRRSILDD